jgi:hypothetical protein
MYFITALTAPDCIAVKASKLICPRLAMAKSYCSFSVKAFDLQDLMIAVLYS